jgi:hypothetical protein
MKRSLWFTLLSTAFAALLFAGCAHHGHMDGMAGDSGPRTDVIYSCACGPECKCGSVSLQPGNCKCGKPMEWGHVVKIEGDVAYVCTCAEGCKCSIDPNDPTKCGCGKELKKVSLKDSGIYYCNCGGKCRCNVLSDKPGECKCGMKLHM